MKKTVNDIASILSAKGVHTFITWAQLAAVSTITWDAVEVGQNTLRFTRKDYTMNMVFVSSYTSYREQFCEATRALETTTSELADELARPERRQSILHYKLSVRLGNGMGPSARKLVSKGAALAATLPPATATFYVNALAPAAWARPEHDLAGLVGEILQPELQSSCLALPLSTVYTLYFLGFPHARFMPAAFAYVFMPLQLCTTIDPRGSEYEFTAY